MRTAVVDASAIAAVIFVEPEGEATAARLADARLVAPSLLYFEVANVCLTKIRRDPGRREELLAALRMLASVEIAVAEIDHDAALLVAERTRLSAYDASYLWLAQMLGTELVTLDKRLDAAEAALRGK